MDTTHTDSPDNFPCQCHLSQYAYEDALCPECEERERNANPDEELEMCEQPGDEGAWENYWDPWGTYCD